MKKNKPARLRSKICFFLIFLFLPACFFTLIPARPVPESSVPLDALIREIANELATVSPQDFSPGGNLLVTTFVELNNLKKTSAFGRLLSERLMTSMSDLGFPVVEIRRGNNIYVIEKGGEMILTRKIGQIPDTVRTGAVIYGTYLVSGGEVLLTARIARSSDFQILKSWNAKITRTPFIANLLAGDGPGSGGNEPGSMDVYEYLPTE